MTTRKLEREEWQSYFDAASRTLPAGTVRMRVDGLDLGDQISADHLPLLGISFDPREDAVHVIAEELDHAISHPRAIYVDEEVEGLRCVEVTDEEGRKQLIELTNAIPLPA
jgi:hypothetical protein